MFMEEAICSQEDNLIQAPTDNRDKLRLILEYPLFSSENDKKLELKSYKRVRVSRRDEIAKEVQKLDDKYSTKEVEKMVFTDEKYLSVEIARNRPNDRV
jgi:hypothetical protein